MWNCDALFVVSWISCWKNMWSCWWFEYTFKLKSSFVHNNNFSAMILNIDIIITGCLRRVHRWLMNLNPTGMLNILFPSKFSELMEMMPGPSLKIKTVFPCMGILKTRRPCSSYRNGNPYTGKTVPLYWDGPRDLCGPYHVWCIG